MSPRAKEAIKPQKNNKLFEYIDHYVTSRNITWQELCVKKANVGNGVSTGIKKGATPQPATLIALAQAMGTLPLDLFREAGYITPSQYELLLQRSDLSDKELKLLELFKSLDDDSQDLWEKVGRAMLWRAEDRK